MPFTPLKALLPQAVRHAGLEKPLGASEVVEVATKTLRTLWPPAQAAFVQPVSFSAGALTVTVLSPSAAHALRTSATAWMQAINQAVGGKRIVHTIVVRREKF
ncbi:MAG: Dna[CI] antecedent, DciA [Candidatus Parcubacteria bacterium]|jgi:hypothetical protein